MEQSSAFHERAAGDIDALAASLTSALGDADRVVTTASVLDEHAADFSLHRPQRPDIVVYAASTSDVVQVLELANRLRVPVVPFGRGTSLEGHVIPVNGGISLDLGRMDRVLDVDADDLVAVVQPGLTRSALNERLRDEGLMFPVDPGADASLGGMAATNASGTTTVRYGNMRRNVLALEVVLAGGRIARLGSGVRKSSAGYDLAALFVGSEGTLGVVTELTLRLHPVPERAIAARLTFVDAEAVCRYAAVLTQLAPTVARLELLDAWTISAINRYQGSADVEEETLLVELSGGEAAVTDDLALLEALAVEHAATSLAYERSAEGRAALWRARHDAAYAVMATGPGKRSLSTDVCVPVSRLAESVALARRTVTELGLEAAIAGHIGDGNYHVAFMVDPTSEEEIRLARRLSTTLVEHALSVGGTCSGEHGIGLGKIDYLESEHATALPLMRAVKAAFDPDGIMNPGKVLRSI